MVCRLNRCKATILNLHFHNNFESSATKYYKCLFFQILESSKNWWRAVNFSGQVGFVPCTILKKLKLEDVSWTIILVKFTLSLFISELIQTI